MSKYELVIFDLDGTLFDTSPGIIGAANEALFSMGYEKCDPQALSKCIGPPLATSMVNAGIIQDKERLRFNSVFRDLYENKYLMDAKLYDGMLGTLDVLHKNVKVAIATNKPQRFTDALISHFSIQKYFDAVHGADLSGQLKKDDLIRQCMKDLEVHPKNTLMVGDTVHDLEGSKNAGVDFIGVSFGFGFSHGDPNTIDSPLELINLVV